MEPPKGTSRLVDRVARHDPVRRVLPSGHDDEPWRRVGDHVLAGQPGGLLALAREQWAQTRVDALDVLLGEPRREETVHVVQEVLDVGRRGGWVGLVEVPVGVGRADDPVPTPRDDEEHRLLGAQDDAGPEWIRSRGTTR
jgi:hypothetical protein